MIKLKDILQEKKDIIKEDKMSPEQMKFAKPIFNAAAKKGNFKIKKIYMSFRPQAEIIVFNYGKDSGSMTAKFLFSSREFWKGEKLRWERSSLSKMILLETYDLPY